MFNLLITCSNALMVLHRIRLTEPIRLDFIKNSRIERLNVRTFSFQRINDIFVVDICLLDLSTFSRQN